MPATAYSYCCYTASIIGFQFVTWSSTRYRILYRGSALNIFVYGSWICIFFMNIFGNRSIRRQANLWSVKLWTGQLFDKSTRQQQVFFKNHSRLN